MKISKELEIAIKTSLVAGKKIIEIYNSNNFDVSEKSDKSPLTIADKESHKIIVDFLSKTSHPILSEEGSEIDYKKRRSWDTFWLVDPIDGTKEFIKKNGEFTVNIALIKNQKTILGVVYAPALKVLYFAEENFGSYKVNNISSFKYIFKGKTQNLKESSYPEIYTMVVSKSHMNHETEDYVREIKNGEGKIKLKSFGSSLKICKVADGEAHCYPRFGPTMEWDTAAAHAVAKYAACRLIDSKSKKELLYNKENLLNPFFLVLSN
jgi:3'(2'), 5'-bisphosphate nucleotidase